MLPIDAKKSARVSTGRKKALFPEPLKEMLAFLKDR